MKLVWLALAILLAIAVAVGITNRPESLDDIRAARDSAKADRDSILAIAESLAADVAIFQKTTDSLKAINHNADTVLVTRVKWLAPQVAHADSVAPQDTLWRPLALKAIDQRDDALKGWADSRAIVSRQDTTIAKQLRIISGYQIYQNKAEARIAQLETWQEKQLRGPRLFGIPLPKLQVTAGLNTRLQPDLVAGLGYTVKFPRRHRPPPSAPR